MNDKKILIIGAKGMLGQELVKTFKSDKDYKVITWDKEDLDIANEVAVSKKIKVINPSIIINAAAYNAVDKCENPKEYKVAQKINGLAPGYLAKIAKKIKATLIHYSTDYVFGGNFPKVEEPKGCTRFCGLCSLHNNPESKERHEAGFNEDDKPKPVNKYGKTKLLGEKEVEKNTKNYYIVRTSKLFGKPSAIQGAKKSFFDIMLELGKKNKNVTVVDDETSYFTYAPDLAKKTKEIIESKKPFGIYHVANSGACTWYEAALELYKQKKIKTEIIPITPAEYRRPAKRPEISTLINTKLNPLRNWKYALKEYLKTR